MAALAAAEEGGLRDRAEDAATRAPSVTEAGASMTLESGDRRPRSELYLLDAGLQEKEDTALAQVASLECPGGGMYVAPDAADAGARAELSERAVTLGRVVFAPIGKREAVPERPHKSGRRGHYISSDSMVAFRGIAGLDLSLVWHMLVVPTFDRVSTDAGDIAIRWVFDLEPCHVPLLEEMRDQGLAFVAANSDYFKEQWAGRESELRDRTIDEWLEPSNIQIGFHIRPSVGYLHVHLLVGPITEFGFKPEYSGNWISVEAVLVWLRSGRPMREALASASGS